MGDTKTGAVWKSKPHNSFVRKDVYTKHIYDPDTSDLIRKDYQYERTFQELESAVAPVVREITGKARSKKCPGLSEEDSNIVKRFLLSMGRRTPESQQRLMSSRSLEDMYYEVEKEWAEQQNQPLPDKDSFYQGIETVRLQQVEHNVDARFAAGDDSRLTQAERKFCRENGLCFGITGIPKRSFVIGSHGTTIFKIEEHEASCLPIAHDVVVTTSPHPGKEALATLGRDKDWLTRKINMAAAHQSRWIASCSERLIRSLMR